NTVKTMNFDTLKGFFSLGVEADLRNYTDFSFTSLQASSNYVIDAVDQYYLDPSRQVAPNSGIAFEGQWGPVHPLNLSDSQKLDIVERIAKSAIDKVRDDIPKLAAEACSVVAVPCTIAYLPCFLGCMAGLVSGAEAAIQPLVNKYGPGL